MVFGPACGRAGVVRCVAFVLALLCLGSPDPSRAETLQEVVDYALATSPELRALASNRLAIDQELNAARGLYLPSLDARGSASRERSREDLSPSGIKNRDIYNQRGAGFSLVQRLYDGFEAEHEIARQRNRVDSARNRVADAANSIALRAVQAYLEVQRAYRVRRVAQGNLSELQALHARVLARVSGGRGNAAEQSESAARLENGKAILAEAEARLRDAQALYLSIIGRAPSSLADVTPPRHALPKGGVNDAVAAARNFAPSVLATRHDAVAAEAAVGGATARLMPRVNLEMTGDRNLGGANYDASYRSDLAAMVVVRWNLFNGGIDKARILEYEARADEARSVSLNTERIIEREVRVSWSAMESAEIRRQALGRQLVFNRQTRRTYSEQFDAGQRRLLDLLEIQNEVFVAEATQATEEAASRYNVYRVLAGMGRLVETLSVEMPAEAVRPKAANILEGWQVRRIERVGDPHARSGNP